MYHFLLIQTLVQYLVFSATHQTSQEFALPLLNIPREYAISTRIYIQVSLLNIPREYVQYKH